MKIQHIIGIIVIAVAIAVIVSLSGDASQYVSFSEAFEMAKDGDDSKIHVVGQLKKDQKGEILGMQYDPRIDPNYFAFTMIDNDGVEKKVIYPGPKPADFERSEQIVVIGSVNNQQFKATKILMKCPSKYQENELEVKEVEIKNS